MFLDLLDPDPLVRGTDPDPSIIKQNSNGFLLFCDFFMTLYLRNDVNLSSKNAGNKQKNYKFFLVGVLKVNDENSRIRIRICWLQVPIRGRVPKCHGQGCGSALI
jgi:hypothetical protein